MHVRQGLSCQELHLVHFWAPIGIASMHTPHGVVPAGEYGEFIYIPDFRAATKPAPANSTESVTIPHPFSVAPPTTTGIV